MEGLPLPEPVFPLSARGNLFHQDEAPGDAGQTLRPRLAASQTGDGEALLQLLHARINESVTDHLTFAIRCHSSAQCPIWKTTAIQ